MSEFWPDDLELEDTLSPREILKEARSEWEERSGGQFTLILQETISKTGNDMLIVHAKHEPSGRTAELFSVVHRPDLSYPATIQPKSEDLPSFLKKEYTARSAGYMHAAAQLGVQDEVVRNRWVADTPAEFRSKLREVLTLGTTKSEIVSLAAARPPAAQPADKTQQVAPATTG